MTILKIDSKVADYLGVAVLLEALGIRDEDAERYGFKDRFALAKRLMEVIEYYRGRGEVVGAEETSLPDRMEDAAKLYIQGILTSSPWLFTTLGMIITGVSLWPARDIGLDFVTVVGLANLLSLVASALIYQVFLRRVLFYFYQEMYGLMIKVLDLYFMFGLGLTALGAFVIVFPAVLGLYGSENLILLSIYFSAFTPLWVAVAPLYAFRKYVSLALIFLLIVAVNNLVVFFLGGFRVLQPATFGIYLISVSAIVFLYTYLSLRLEGVKMTMSRPRGSMEAKASLPGLSFIILPGIPYGIGGALYFILLFTDRLVVWSGGLCPRLLVDPLYEAGANLSLLILVPVLGSLNYTMISMYREIVEGGERLMAKDMEAYRRIIRRSYWRAVAYNVAVGLAALIFLYAVLSQYSGATIFDIVTVGSNLLFILLVEGGGNLLLIIFLMNSLLFNYLYRPWLTIYSALPAVITNLVLGSVLVRTLGVEYACIGYITGMSIAALVSTYIASNIIRRIDYAYYTAF